MKYDVGKYNEKSWVITEDKFDKSYLGKCESIMSLGNGYMGIRSATEELYMGEIRNTFIAGTFNKIIENKIDKFEVTELPNVADVVQMEIEINGEVLDLTKGIVKNYSRQLNIKTGELTRVATWISTKGDEVELVFRRFVSLDNLHVIGQKIEIIPKNKNIEISLKSGINGQVTNSGAQHFLEGDKRLYEKKYMQMVQTTTQSQIDFVINTVHSFTINSKVYEPKNLILIERRKIFYQYNLEVKKEEKFVIEKISNIYTSRDIDNEGINIEELKVLSYEALKNENEKGYNLLLDNSKKMWQEKVWNNYDIEIDSEDDYDQLAIRFAHYHLTIMTPAHDNRMNIGAKGLSGEGYKGHTFWDTEIFILPFFTYTDPKVARSLLEYRYKTLPGAHKKAKENGYEGAMFPWESAWFDDGEVTPLWGAADIVTGKSTKIWSGIIEQHITSDVAFACWQYYQVTKDEDFMDQYGYELLMETANFWQSRLEWNEIKEQYYITGVMGPDEYKEHIDNNAFTNYTAHWTIKNAINYYKLLKNEKIEVFDRLNKKLNLDKVYKKWEEKVDKIYLPQPREDLVIPQDDTYLEKEIIDLTKYRNQENVGTLGKDYNVDGINNIQVSKQADIMALFYLLEDLFEKDVKIANWNYYEPKTLHDSSLSLSTHCVLANDLNNNEMAYSLFKKATFIDLGPNMKTSDGGIHAASLGGIWQCVVNGFGGIRMLNGKLRIEPHLPQTWKRLKFPINWHGDRLIIEVTKNKIIIKNETKNNPSIEFESFGVKLTINEEISFSYNN